MTLKSLGLALDVLAMFTKENPSWGLRDLSKEMGVNHTVLYRILRTFEERKIIVQDESSKKYQLGSGLASVLAAYKDQNKMSDLVYPVMKELSNTTRESVFLTWLIDDAGVTVEIAEGPSNIRFAVSKGTVTPLHAGASSKAILAFLSQEDKNRVLKKNLERLTSKTMTSKEKLMKELDKIQEDKWAYTFGEFSEDVFGLSTPIFDQLGNVIASLTIAGPVYRIDEERKDIMLKHLQEATAQITEYVNLFDRKMYH